MNTIFQLDKYLNDGIEAIIKGAVKASLKNPRESLFIARFALSSKEAEKTRKRLETEGQHIPPFLICSITDSCNLNCQGCYAKANHLRRQYDKKSPLEIEDWKRIFGEAQEAGISFILLAGGEPLMRVEVIEAAADYKRIIFPVFTNGTLIEEHSLTLFDKHRNLLPIISVEGNRDFTNSRRGSGIYEAARTAMEEMYKRGIFYGISITATGKNLSNITDEAFVAQLYDKGCKVIFYVEYVPVSGGTKDLALSDKERELLEEKLSGIRKLYSDLIILSFPGDEKSAGGCLAAGRGFFHINTDGSAEPCPFSPYSDTNIKNLSLLKALQSPLFHKLTSDDILIKDHIGGCVLFENDDKVKEICRGVN